MQYLHLMHARQWRLQLDPNYCGSGGTTVNLTEDVNLEKDRPSRRSAPGETSAGKATNTGGTTAVVLRCPLDPQPTLKV